MLPVLIDGDLQSRTDNKDAFVERIRGLLRELIGETEVVYEELLLVYLYAELAANESEVAAHLRQEFGNVEEEPRLQLPLGMLLGKP